MFLKFKIQFFTIIFFSYILSANSQISERWTIGVNSSSVLYSKDDSRAVEGRYIAIIPGISVSKYIGNKMTVTGFINKEIKDDQKYLSFNVGLSYDVFSSFETINPYLLVGAGVINAIEVSPTVNFGAGGTWWINDRFGLNAQLIYKVNLSGDMQKSHYFGSGGVVYSFNFGARTKNRIWER